MRRRRTLALGVACLFAAGGAGRPSTAAADPAAGPPLNVLMIAVDDLRPDIGCYGSPVAKTPNIDRLAARGVVFGHAYCQQAVCSPSRTSLLTGRRPDETRVFDLKTHFRSALPDCVTLPQHFKAHGYHCAALGKIYHRGFEDGRSWSEPHWYPTGRSVDTAPDDWSRQITKKIGAGVEEYAAGTPRTKSGRGPATEVSAKADDELPDGFTAAEAVRRIAALATRERPFFLAVGFLKPHLPFVAPKKYWDLHDPAAIPEPAIDHLPQEAPAFAGHTNGEIHQYFGIPPGNPLPRDVARRLRHGYHACISYTDAQVGRLLDALDQAGVADRTVVVLWGDHGWQLGDHGLWHKHTNFELATRAPLIIASPGCTAGRTAAAPVEFVDVYPTLAEACGLPPAAGVAGTSLVPLLRDPSASVKPVAISQYPRGAGDGDDVRVMGYSIRDERWRFTAWREDGGTRIVAMELYDEQADPHETRNVASDPRHKPVIDRLAAHLPPPGPASPKATRPPKATDEGRPTTAAEPKRRLADGWEHHRGTLGSVWEVWRGEKASDNVAWTQVSLPHCFNARDAVDPDDRYYQGHGWYRTRLESKNPFPRGRTLLHFDGAGQATTVFVHLDEVGGHLGGYDQWTLDVTDAAARALADESCQGKVPLAVRCDNSRDAESIPSDLSDFNRYGGLYRHVHLAHVPAVSLETPATTTRRRERAAAWRRCRSL